MCFRLLGDILFQILGLNKWIIGLIAVGIIAALFSGFVTKFEEGTKEMLGISSWG